ncbi:hypothetical protein DITRI_Ditri08aG0053600 [Diplodiscus trichospermus]
MDTILFVHLDQLVLMRSWLRHINQGKDQTMSRGLVVIFLVREIAEFGSRLLGRWLSSHYHGGVHDEKSFAHHTADSALDQMDWIEKIIGVIASLPSSQAPKRCLSASPIGSGHYRFGSKSSSFESSDFDQTSVEEFTSERNLVSAHNECQSRASQLQRSCIKMKSHLMYCEE